MAEHTCFCCGAFPTSIRSTLIPTGKIISCNDSSCGAELKLDKDGQPIEKRHGKRCTHAGR